MRPHVLLASPLSGAVSGVEAVTQAILACPLKDIWAITHVDTATARLNRDRGLPTPQGVWRMGQLIGRMCDLCQTHPQAAMIQLAQSRGGFLKFALLAWVAFRHKVPVIARFGGGDFHRFYSWLDPVSRVLVRSTLNRCAAVLVEAQCLQSQFVGILPEEKIRWAYLGVDETIYPLPDRIRRARRLLYMGHISQAKGAADLLEAMEIMRRDRRDMQVTMLGERLPKERNVPGRWGKSRDPSAEGREGINTPGILVGEEKLAALRDADIFVFPSHSEGLPIAVLEAMASGLPMICTPVGALPEILTDGVNCDFVPVGQPGMLARTILDLAWSSSRFRRRAMSLENREAIEDRFTLGNMADGFRRAVGDITEGHYA